MKKTILKYISTIVLLLSVASCTMDLEPVIGQDGEKVKVRFSVGLDGVAASRGKLTADDYTNAPQFSDGTRATHLIYAIFDEDGEIVPIPDPDKDGNPLVERVAKEVKFPCEISLDLIRGKKYTAVFWAQCGNEMENTFYDTSNLKAIRVYYNREGDDSQYDNLNNEERRDAFCATLNLDANSLKNDISVTLHRPFAQINIGVSQKAWDALKTSNVFIKESEIVVNHVAWNFNLYENKVVDDVNDVYGDTQSYKTASFMKNTIPYNLKINENDGGNHMLTIKNGSGETSDYYWLSMSYVLVAGNEQSSVVDISDIAFYYNNSDGSDANAISAVDVLRPTFTKLENVPVRRNYRTNILFDDDLTGTAKIVLDLNSKYYDDITSQDWGESWDGRIARGVSVTNYRNRTDKVGQYGFWLDFNVSSVEGLKWIARRSNGIAFTEEDIPTWQVADKDGSLKTTTYKEFQDENGNPSLGKYRDKIFEMIEGHALIPFRCKVLKDIDKVWTFDDAAIVLVNDIDFEGETWTEPISTMHGKRSVPSEMTSISPWIDNAFKGTFDGNGYTIQNLHLDCRQYGVDKTLHEGAGLIGVASDLAVVKNLRLFNVTVTGDWNIGGLVGFYGNGNGSFLTIDNVRIENCNFNAIRSNINPNGDSNLGSLVGSLQGITSDQKNKNTIKNCKILNTTLNSSYLVGSLVGVLGAKDATIKDCVLMEVAMVLSDYNDIGNGKDFNLNKRSNNPKYALLFGNDIGNRQNLLDNVSLTNVGLGYFAADNKQNTSGSGLESDGIGSVTDLPLDKFPVLEAKYGRGVELLSHITGTPSQEKSGNQFGILVNMYEKLDKDWNTNREDGLNFVISGKWNEQMERLYTLNIKPGTKTTYGIGFIGDASLTPSAKVENLIVNGVPTINGGIYLDNIKDVTLDNIAVYNVPKTLVVKNIPEKATLTVTNSDFRGDTEYGAGYESVTFTNTAFYLGTGTSKDNGTLRPGSTTVFDGCHFREGFRVDLSGLEGTLTFKNCKYGKAKEEVDITADNIEAYLGVDPSSSKVVVE